MHLGTSDRQVLQGLLPACLIRCGVSRRSIWAHAIDWICNIGGCFLLEVCCEQAMPMGLSVNVVSDHAKKRLVAYDTSDCE